MHPSDNSSGASLGLTHSTIRSSRDTNVQVIQSRAPAKDAMEILKSHVAFGALFNSRERFDPPKCHPDTRKAVLELINRWSTNQDLETKPIIWLRGAAGAGKSAIAQTSAERLARLKRLAASFFFSRTGARRNENTYLIATIAYQLALSIPETRPHIERAILDDMGLFEKGLIAQMSQLIVVPLVAVLTKEGRVDQQIVIIDGLDECSQDLHRQDHEAQQREVLEALAFYHHAMTEAFTSDLKQDPCPLRFLIASRPEWRIRTSFSSQPLNDLSNTIVPDGTQNPDADIELYLRCRFNVIRLNHPYLGSLWPPDGTIAQLIQKSSGHFIYAATAARYLERPRQDPRVSLTTILNITTSAYPRDAPFAELDALYTLIMTTVLPDSLPVVLDIFKLMCFNEHMRPDGQPIFQVFTGCQYLSPTSLERHLFLPSGSITYIHLIDLHSILEIPPADGTSVIPIRFSHASFSEFLTTQARSGSFFIERIETHIQFQPIRLKHILIQSLTADFGEELGYNPEGFVTELLWELEHVALPPLPNIAKGLAALIGEDEEEFACYIRSVNLAHIGTKRSRNAKYLPLMGLHASGPDFTSEDAIGVILAYLRICGIENCKPLLGNRPKSLELGTKASYVASFHQPKTEDSTLDDGELLRLYFTTKQIDLVNHSGLRPSLPIKPWPSTDALARSIEEDSARVPTLYGSSKRRKGNEVSLVPAKRMRMVKVKVSRT